VRLEGNISGECPLRFVKVIGFVFPNWSDIGRQRMLSNLTFS